MGCLCNIFDDCNIWLIIAVLVVLYLICNSGDCCCN